MKILTDLNAVVSSLTNVIVTTATKTDSIVDNVLSVGEIASGEWKLDAVFEADKAKVARAAAMAAFNASLSSLDED